jgi:hypothetical protein
MLMLARIHVWASRDEATVHEGRTGDRQNTTPEPEGSSCKAGDAGGRPVEGDDDDDDDDDAVIRLHVAMMRSRPRMSAQPARM